jgi:hypothetical protein
MALIKAKFGLLPHRSAHVHALSPRRNEAAWWKDAGIDPAKAARKFGNDTRMDQGRIGDRMSIRQQDLCLLNEWTS